VSSQLELMLCRLHQRKYCHLIGNATTGIYLCLKIQGFTSKKIGIPNGVCPNVPLAVYLAGAEPVYLDISKVNLGLSLSNIESTSNLAAIIAVHAYGMPCDIEDIETYCNKNGICVIEDAAVAQGAIVGTRPVGSFGSMSVVSFGVGKIIAVGGGGAILTDDKEIYQALVNYDRELPPYQEHFRKNISDLGAYHTRLYNELYLSGEYEALPNLYKQHAISYGASFLHRFQRKLESDIIQRLKILPTLIQSRKETTDCFHERFSRHNGIGIRPIIFPDGSVPWRFNLLIDRVRDQVLDSLLNSNVKVSSWYPSVDMFFERRSHSGVCTPTSDFVSSTILNLWVNELADEKYICDVSRQIIRQFSELIYE